MHIFQISLIWVFEIEKKKNVYILIILRSLQLNSCYLNIIDANFGRKKPETSKFFTYKVNRMIIIIKTEIFFVNNRSDVLLNVF